MDECERGRTIGCGWLLVIVGLFALVAAALVWVVSLEIRPANGSGVRVWITPSGTRYHRRSCPALKRSEPRVVALHEALEQGLGPCDLCDPPT